VVHANARLTPAGRPTVSQGIAAGRPVAHVAAEMGTSRTCAYRWWARYQQLGQPGLVDRPSTVGPGWTGRPSGWSAATSAPQRASCSTRPRRRRRPHQDVAYAEVLADERGDTRAGFLRRAGAFFAAHGIAVQRVLTDNGGCCRSRAWRQLLQRKG
jgi:leucine-zipper of insertion element IS481